MMLTLKYMSTVGICIILLCVKSIDAQEWDAAMQARVDEFVEKILTCRDILGINLAIVKGNQTLYTQGYGVKDLDTGEPVTNETLIGVASLSKAFTSTLLGQLLHDHSKTWDTPVRTVLGDDFYFYDGLRSNRTTLRDLASHTTGIPSNNNARMQRPTRAELAQKMRFFQPRSEFRASYVYSNLMYGLMSYIAEVLEPAKTWETLTRDNIFNPLGMSSATFTHEVSWEEADIALPHLLDDNSTWFPVSLNLHSIWGELGGSGSILTSANEMAQWLHLQLNQGKNKDGEQVIDSDVIEETHKPENVIPEGSSDHLYRPPNIPVAYDFHRYGKGWRIGSYRGYRLILHTGTSWGYGGLISLLPEAHIGVYTSITGPDGGYIGRRLIHMYIMDLLLNEDPWLTLDAACTFPQQDGAKKKKSKSNKQFRTSSPENPTEYTGTFGNFGYGNISVVDIGAESLQLNYNTFKWSMEYKGDDKFFGRGLEMWDGIRDITDIDFQRESSGEITGVTLSLESRDPPYFLRDLKMSDAPPPPNPNYCGSGQPEYTGNASSCYVSITLLFLCFCTRYLD